MIGAEYVSLKNDGSADHFVPQNMLIRLISTVALF